MSDFASNRAEGFLKRTGILIITMLGFITAENSWSSHFQTKDIPLCFSHPLSLRLSSHPVMFPLNGLCLPSTPCSHPNPSLYTLELFRVSKFSHFIRKLLSQVLNVASALWLGLRLLCPTRFSLSLLWASGQEGGPGRSLFWFPAATFFLPATSLLPWSSLTAG